MATPKSKNVLKVTDILDLKENSEPVQVPVGDSKLVTFPDIFDWEMEEGERFLREMNRAANELNVVPFLKKWISEDDYEALKKRFPSYRKMAALVNRVMAKYEESWGTVGEDRASEN